MSDDEFDVGGSAPDGSLGELTGKLEELIRYEETVANLEEDLKAAKKRLHHLKTVEIPEMMAERSVDMLKFTAKESGRAYKVSVDAFVSGTLPSDPDRRAAAIDWLVENGASDLVKTTVGLEFGRTEHNAALSVAGHLREEGYEPKVATSVHPQTLAAFARERIRNGDPIDPETLGLYTGRVAKVSKA